MDQKDKELIAVAASIAAGCEHCTQYHVREARAAGADAADLERMVRLSLSVRGRATARMEEVGWKELGKAVANQGCACDAPPTALEALASAASALAANCGSGVPLFLAAAKNAGAEERDCQVALGLARKIKRVSAEKAEEQAGAASRGRDEECCAAATAASGGGCCEATA